MGSAVHMASWSLGDLRSQHVHDPASLRRDPGDGSGAFRAAVPDVPTGGTPVSAASPARSEGGAAPGRHLLPGRVPSGPARPHLRRGAERATAARAAPRRHYYRHVGAPQYGGSGSENLLHTEPGERGDRQDRSSPDAPCSAQAQVRRQREREDLREQTAGRLPRRRKAKGEGKAHSWLTHSSLVGPSLLESMPLRSTRSRRPRGRSRPERP